MISAVIFGIRRSTSGAQLPHWSRYSGRMEVKQCSNLQKSKYSSFCNRIPVILRFSCKISISAHEGPREILNTAKCVQCPHLSYCHEAKYALLCLLFEILAKKGFLFGGLCQNPGI